MKNRTQNALLLEIMLSILIFALASACLLKVFYAVYENANDAKIKNEALIVIKDLSEALYAEECREDILIKEGFLSTESGYRRDYEGFTLFVNCFSEKTPAGELRSAEIGFFIENALECTFPVSRYLPREATA